MIKLLITGLKGGVGRTMIAESLRYVAAKEAIDLEVIDGHARLNCDLRQKAQAADMAIIVAEAGVFGRLDISFLVNTFKEDQIACGVVLNKVQKKDPELADLLKTLKVPLLGEIADNRYYAYALSEGKILAEEDKTVYQMMQQIIQRVMKELGKE